MGREVRIVPTGWEHPRDENRCYVPLMRGPFAERLAEWEMENQKWQEGFQRDYAAYPGIAWKPKCANALACADFAEWFGERPEQSQYMPEFAPGTATMLMMYETCTEGTPISPAFGTAEELAHWLADTNASAFGYSGASYEAWLATIRAGHSVASMVIIDGQMVDGVTAVRLIA